MILPKVTLTAGDGARAEIYAHGAHVTSWTPAGGREKLFLSSLSEFGAVPRFAAACLWSFQSTFGPLPKHGLRDIRAGRRQLWR